MEILVSISSKALDNMGDGFKTKVEETIIKKKIIVKSFTGYNFKENC